MKTSFLTALVVTLAVAYGKDDKHDKTPVIYQTSTSTTLTTPTAYQTPTFTTLTTPTAYQTSTHTTLSTPTTSPTSTHTTLSTTTASQTSTHTTSSASSTYHTSTYTTLSGASTSQTLTYTTLSTSSGFRTSTYATQSVNYSVSSSRAINHPPTPAPAPICPVNYTPLCSETSKQTQNQKTTENPSTPPVSSKDFEDQCSSIGMIAQCCIPDGNSQNLKCSLA